jgi:predicted transcriptional regulator
MYARRQRVDPDDLPALITSVAHAFVAPPLPEKLPKQVPAVPIRHSIGHDYIVCLEDGTRMKSMKRYIMRCFGLTPDAYRQKWGLSPEYPMVAPEYRARRSALARQAGLGRQVRVRR